MLEGWNPEKVAIFRESFFLFLNQIKVNSKDKGEIILGEHVFRGQRMMLDQIFEGLAEDRHDFKALKSRQLGISTLSRALTLFWIGVHGGLKGYMVLDTTNHLDEARIELIGMIESLPPEFKFPRIKRQNRYMLQLDNDSIINFAAAGVKQGKGSGTLGRGSGVNFVHASEMCSWASEEGLESFLNSLSEDFPNRLYLWESTARGFNMWHDMWEAAKKDDGQVTIFLGWWSKDNQQIRRDHPNFARYGLQPPTEAEAKKIRLVKERYGWDITPEQLAWVRKKMDPTAEAEGDGPVEYEGDVLRVQEQPWTEEEAFQVTGATFFEGEVLTEMVNKHASKKYKAFFYTSGIEFADCRIYPAPNAKTVQLKVWEEPENDAVYVIAADPAYGSSEFNDRSCCQVYRAYADGLDMVAEYCYPMANTKQFAWVISSLLGYYSTVGGQGKADVYFILELNGPGESVLLELNSLKHILRSPYQPKPIEEAGIRNIFQNVKNFIYSRSDSMNANGTAWHWKTSGRLKVLIMERLRDFVTTGLIHIRSMDMLMEMKSITREGDSIEAAGSKKDDRVMTGAMAVHCWENRARKTLINQRRTRQFEASKKTMTIRDQINMFNESQLTSFFKAKAGFRTRQAALLRRQSWRGRV